MYVILLGDSVSGPLKIRIPANRRGFFIYLVYTFPETELEYQSL